MSFDRRAFRDNQSGDRKMHFWQLSNHMRNIPPIIQWEVSTHPSARFFKFRTWIFARPIITRRKFILPQLRRSAATSTLAVIFEFDSKRLIRSKPKQWQKLHPKNLRKPPKKLAKAKAKEPEARSDLNPTQRTSTKCWNKSILTLVSANVECPSWTRSLMMFSNALPVKPESFLDTTRKLPSREIQTAVRLMLPGELAKHAVSEGTKAVTKYTSSA